MSTEDYPISARIRKWDGSAWIVVMFIPTDSIIDVRCNFKGYRIEDTATVTAIDRGLISADPTTQTLIEDINDQVDSVYRLDIHASDQTQQVDTREWGSASVIPGMIYWSGRIQRISQDEALHSRKVDITAVGWSSFLDKTILRDRVYVNATPISIVRDVVAQLSPQLPGELALLTVGRGTINSLRIDTLSAKALTASSLLSAVSRFGNFSFGLSVSGFGAQTHELRVIDDDMTNWDLISNALAAVVSISGPPLGFPRSESTYLLETDSGTTFGLYSIPAGSFEKDGLQQKFRLYVREPEEGGKTDATLFSISIASNSKIWAVADFAWASGVPTIVVGDATIVKMDDDWYRVELTYTSDADSADELRFLLIEVGATNAEALTVYAPDLVSDADFTLVFFEAGFDNDLEAGAAGDFKQQVGMVVDENGVNTIGVEIKDRGGQHYNAWEFLGEPGFLDFLSTITDNTSLQFFDYGFESRLGDSGVGRWETTLKGARCVMLDFARRVQFRNQESGEVFLAGGLGALPSRFLRRSEGVTDFLITDYSEEGGSGPTGKRAAFSPHQWPGLPVRDLENQSYRYTLTSGGLQVHRAVEDAEETAAREKVSRLVVDAAIRGTVQAGVFAQQDLYAQEANRRSAVIALRNVRTLPNGHIQRERNAIVLTGEAPNQRLTLYGTTSNSGDNYGKADDSSRLIGAGRTFEIRRVRMRYADGGWDVLYDLGGAPADLKAAIVPKGTSGRGIQR